MTESCSHAARLRQRSLVRPRPARLRHARAVATSPAASPVQTPHSGFHVAGRREGFEGWYWRVTLPDDGGAEGEPSARSFALIYSYERGLQPCGDDGRVGVQVMGPGDGYVAQTSTDTASFWGERNALALGACLTAAPGRAGRTAPKHMLDPSFLRGRPDRAQAAFDAAVREGFQASATRHQGRVINAPGTCPGQLRASVQSAEWAFDVRPVYGWGDAGGPQRSTASWLAALPLFEPHWQIVMAHGVASGHFRWGEESIDFEDCPCYAEKNWGFGFPKKWAWIQCNSFQRTSDLAITAVGAIRSLTSGSGAEEKVGLVGIHHRGRFIDLQCFDGPMRWDVTPWGRWRFWIKTSEHEALVEATCASDTGMVLRAPCGAAGLAPICKDTFAGNVRLRVWRLGAGGARAGPPMIDDVSSSAALEVGGGPWWDEWRVEAQANPAVNAAVKLPLEDAALALRQALPFDVPDAFLPPGY